ILQINVASLAWDEHWPLRPSYSRDLALQLNSFTTQLDDREDGLKATTDANHNGRIGPIWFYLELQTRGPILKCHLIPSTFRILMSSSSLWQRFQQHLLHYCDLGLSLVISRMKFTDDFIDRVRPLIAK